MNMVDENENTALHLAMGEIRDIVKLNGEVVSVRTSRHKKSN